MRTFSGSPKHARASPSSSIAKTLPLGSTYVTRPLQQSNRVTCAPSSKIFHRSETERCAVLRSIALSLLNARSGLVFKITFCTWSVNEVEKKRPPQGGHRISISTSGSHFRELHLKFSLRIIDLLERVCCRLFESFPIPKGIFCSSCGSIVEH